MIFIKDKNGEKYVSLNIIVGVFIIFLFLANLFTLIMRNSEEYTFFDVLSIKSFIEENYITDVKSEEIYKNSIKGMISQLDNYSEINFDGEIFNYENSYKGAGVTFQYYKEGLKIDKIEPYSNLNGKVDIGDYIIEANGVKYYKIEQFLKEIVGEIGDVIDLKIYSVKKNKIITTSVEIQNFDVKYFTGSIIEEDYLHLKLDKFVPHLSDKILSFCSELKKSRTSPLKGIILDLRDNPGGIVEEAAKISDLFVDTDISIAISLKFKNEIMPYYVKEKDIFKNIPMVVLVNENSASASEMLSGVLQYFDRAKIIGHNTRGKGVGQTIFSMKKEDAFIKITSFEYFIGKEQKVNKIGIIPDIEVGYPYFKKSDIYMDTALKILKQ